MIDVTFLTNEDKDELEQKIEEGGGGSGVSSWNDLTDKPFGETTGMMEVLPETVLDMTNGGNLDLPYSLGLVVGRTYIVNWRGVEYESIAREIVVDGRPAVCIGSYYGDGLDADKPYVFLDRGYRTEVVANDRYEAAECSIATEGTILHKLDNKYLDLDWLPTVGETELLAQQTLTTTGIPQDILGVGVDVYAASLKSTIDLNETTEIVVEVDGVKYDAYYVVGNGVKLIVSSPSSPAIIGGKFYAYWAEGNGVFCHVTEGTHTFAVYEKVANKMPAEFLPDGVPYVKENVLLKESNANSFTHPSFGTMWGIYSEVPNLVVGKTYTVIYNGTPYNCVCQTAPAGLIDDPNAVAMGNFSPVGGADTGEPFAMLVSYAYQEVDIIDLVGSSAVTVKISQTTAASELYLSSPNGTIFKITVSDDGTLSAAEVTE